MGRAPRVRHPGATYHVFNRGARRQVTFADDTDRTTFMRLLGVVADRYRLEVHAYCLMGNHYHLLVRSPDANIAESMQHLIGVYTRRFNLHHGFDGALFRGRYESVVIDGDEQFIATSRYIHRNPLEAGLVDTLERYRHSSFRTYVGLDARPRWLRTGLTLALFADDRARYATYVER